VKIATITKSTVVTTENYNLIECCKKIFGWTHAVGY